MTALHPCPDCERHVRSDETTCPFCDAALGSMASSHKRSPGRLARAALFAGATMLGTACGGEAANDEEEVDVGDGDVTNGGDDGDDGDEIYVEDDYVPPPDDDVNYDMPYGAPPARDRIV